MKELKAHDADLRYTLSATKKMFVVDNSVDRKPLIEVEVEYTNDRCTIITDVFSGCVIGEWCDPVAQKVWNNPQDYV